MSSTPQDREAMASTLGNTAGTFTYMLRKSTEPLLSKLKQKEDITETVFHECLVKVKSMLSLLNTMKLCDQDFKSDQNYEKLLCDIIKGVCFPLIYSLHLLKESDGRGALGVLINLLRSCCHELSKQTLPVAISQVFIPVYKASNNQDTKLLSLAKEEYHVFCSEPLSQQYCLDLVEGIVSDEALFKSFLSNSQVLHVDKNDVLESLFKFCTTSVQEQFSLGKTYTTLAKLFKHFSPDLRNECKDKVWSSYTQPEMIDGFIDMRVMWQSLYMFYCLKDYLFPVDVAEKESLEAQLTSDGFWQILQASLKSSESLYRKQAIYLLKRLVDTCDKSKCNVNTVERDGEFIPMFWWSSAMSKQLSSIWEDFILLYEVLEEKQVHVVKPLLPRMRNLMKAASEKAKEGHSLFHCSWLIVIVTRCFDHDSHYMSRWGAHTLLTTDFHQIPLIQHGQLKFLSINLLTFLQENRLYSRYEGTALGASSPVASAMKTYFARLFDCLTQHQKAEYLENMFGIICDNSWGSIPLVFVFEGLSCIPPSPIIGPDLLLRIRQILQSCLTTHELVTKGAIQCFICEMLINLVDVATVSAKEMMRTLAALNRAESFQRNTPLWDKVLTLIETAFYKGRWSEEDAADLALGFIQDNHPDSSVTVEGYRVVTNARTLLLYADLAERKSLSDLSQATATTSIGSADVESIDNKAVYKSVLKSPLGKALREVSDTLSGISTRAYVDVGRVNRSLSLLYSLSLEAAALGDSTVDKFLTETLGSHFSVVSQFVQMRFTEELDKVVDAEEIKFYWDVLLSLGLYVQSINFTLECENLLKFITKVFVKAEETAKEKKNLEKMDVLVMSATGLLETICRLMDTSLSKKGRVRIETLDYPYMETLFSCLQALENVASPFLKRFVTMGKDATSRARIGHAVSQFTGSKWQCCKFFMKHCFEGDTIDCEHTLAVALEDLAVGSGSSDVAIYKALYLIMPKIVKEVSPEDVSQFLSVSWAKVMEEKKNKLFWEKLDALIPLALHPAIVRQDQSSVIGEALEKLLENLETLGEDKAGILNLTYANLCNGSLNKRADPDRQIALRLIPWLVKGCYSGQLHKRGERLWLDVCAYIESLGKSCCVNHITSSMSKNDMFTRLSVLNWLSKLHFDSESDVKFAQAFLEHLRATYLTLAKQSTFKQFSNSLSHRQKHRMVLVFLLLVEFITEDISEQYINTLWYALEIECHPSVRQNLEWLVIILLRKYPSHVNSIWETLKQYSERRSICICSLFLILCHVGSSLPQNMQVTFYDQALAKVLPWSMAHHYNTHIFGQTCLVTLWKQCQTLELEEVLTKHSVVQGALDFLFHNWNASNTVVKLLENYMFSTFDPVKDYSIETVFYTMPKLACISDDEWITPDHFIQTDKNWADGPYTLIPLKNESQQLAACKPGPWRMKAHIENDEEISESADNSSGDVQKKIMPWRQMIPDQETEAELSLAQRQRGSKDGLILVTSFIDKVPNLGGLCRTSEIFGVSEMVIGNLSYLQDKMFQSLSVSAQKWINITEVMRPRISEYLAEKRAEGYTLVGVEQTANSVSLQKYTFPKKTLLLLGNEKEGIPVDVLQSLDVCVEIPQLGVIRSLNVHVCGALIVWEYTRQHMQDQEGDLDGL